METANMNPTLIEAIKSAAEHWSNVIVRDVTPDFMVGSMEHSLFPLDGAVDDLVIGFGIANTDGIDGTSFGLFKAFDPLPAGTWRNLSVRFHYW